MDANHYRTTPLDYGHIEAAIAAVLDVKEDNIKALRARLRHLRNIGVPDIDRPGSGKKVEYSRLNALEMLMCVELERGGYTPRAAAMVGPEIAAKAYHALYPFDGDEVYALVMPSEEDRPFLRTAKGSNEFMKMMRQAPASGFFVKASTLARKLERKLDEYTAT